MPILSMPRFRARCRMSSVSVTSFPCPPGEQRAPGAGGCRRAGPPAFIITRARSRSVERQGARKLDSPFALRERPGRDVRVVLEEKNPPLLAGTSQDPFLFLQGDKRPE